MRYNLPALNCYSQTNYTPTADSFIEPAVVIFGFLGLSLVRQSLFYCGVKEPAAEASCGGILGLTYFLASSTSFANAAGSLIAISLSILRLIVTFACLRPCMNVE